MRFLQNAVLAALKRVQLFLDDNAAVLAAIVDLTAAGRHAPSEAPRAVAGLRVLHTGTVDETDLALMRRLDELHLELPFAGSRMLRDLLRTGGRTVRPAGSQPGTQPLRHPPAW